MTARQVFEATLIELSKVQAPSLKLYEFNYLFNKAINQYINKVYNVYDINQQTTDDLRVLKATAYLDPSKVNGVNVGESKSATEQGAVRTASSYLSRTRSSIQSLNGATYEVFMPMDYLHILNCVCIYYVAKTKDCWDAGSYIQIPATRLTADSWSQILTDIYNRPSPMRPYYYINNINQNISLPTNAYAEKVTVKEGEEGEEEEKEVIKINKGGTDINGEYWVEKYNDPVVSTGNTIETTTEDGEKEITRGDAGSNFKRTFTLNGKEQSVVEKPIASRIGNASNVRCEIRYGWDDSVFQLVEVQVDYVKVPQHIRLTQEQLDLTEDTSQIMEFPDYVNQEIINELVHLVMLRTQTPGLGDHIQISQTIARPTQQQQQPAQQG